MQYQLNTNDVKFHGFDNLASLHKVYNAMEGYTKHRTNSSGNRVPFLFETHMRTFNL